ncbi:GNAT family N-acetyltransferase [Thiocystis violacea]|uniref:GNAT family N-acetyltransferase n=1 Tax=Thiocystis violacea TaxID=13725 RepID=UPI001903CEAB|nr:GNAT family N-acetyltransferase [Thiocystis violacea]MBK1721471.1 hypothetical protein [Thiocystis violacea]
MLNPDRAGLGYGGDFLLRDGTSYRIRPIGAADRRLVFDCFEALSPDARRLRFFGVKPALSQSDLDFLTGADGRDHLALGAVRLTTQGDEVELIGAARCIRLGAGSDTSELAMAVIDKAQGLGIGKALLRRLVEVAGARGIRRFRCEVMAANHGMRALADGLGSRARWLEDGTLEYEYPFACPTTDVEEPLRFPMDLLMVSNLTTAAWTTATVQCCEDVFALGRSLLAVWLERWPAWEEPLPTTPKLSSWSSSCPPLAKMSRLESSTQRQAR